MGVDVMASSAAPIQAIFFCPDLERLYEIGEQARRLATRRGQAVYRLRVLTVEPVHGQLKQAMGFRQFLLRGLAKVRGEWALLCTAFNLRKLWSTAYGERESLGVHRARQQEGSPAPFDPQHATPFLRHSLLARIWPLIPHYRDGLLVVFCCYGSLFFHARPGCAEQFQRRTVDADGVRAP